MDRGPMMFTSDVSLPRDEKTAMPSERITAGKLTRLKMHRNVNYATRELEVQSYGQYARKLDRLFIIIYLLIIHLEISIQNISLVLSCEPHPKCKPKATNNFINTLCVR